MNTFCTIITGNYYPYALALYKSLYKYDLDVMLHVLVADEGVVPFGEEPGMKMIAVKEISQYTFVSDLTQKYAHLNPDFFRWSLKPVWMSYLLETGFSKVLFVDCDIFFFEDYSFLFDALNHDDILLTREWYTAHPSIDPTSFGYLLTNGAFNAGFVGSNKNGLPVLHWWAKACYHKMGMLPEKGLYVDQKYLDLFPILFNSVKILDHKGCNLGSAGHHECPRSIQEGQVLIAEKFTVVFIHFNTPLIKQILMGYDPLLLPYYQRYKMKFDEYGIPMENFLNRLKEYINPSVMKKVKWKLRLRTRVKAFLHKLATKL